jgi:hypothetical protein
VPIFLRICGGILGAWPGGLGAASAATLNVSSYDSVLLADASDVLAVDPEQTVLTA